MHAYGEIEWERHSMLMIMLYVFMSPSWGGKGISYDDGVLRGEREEGERANGNFRGNHLVIILPAWFG